MQRLIEDMRRGADGVRKTCDFDRHEFADATTSKGNEEVAWSMRRNFIGGVPV